MTRAKGGKMVFAYSSFYSSFPPLYFLLPFLLLLFFWKNLDEGLRTHSLGNSGEFCCIKWISAKATVVWVPGILHVLFYLMFSVTSWDGIVFMDGDTEAQRVWMTCLRASNPPLSDQRALGLPSSLRVFWQEALRANWKKVNWKKAKDVPCP